MECITGGLDDVVSAGGAPLDLGGVQLVGDCDALAIDNQVLVLGNNGAGIATVDGIILLL